MLHIHLAKLGIITVKWIQNEVYFSFTLTTNLAHEFRFMPSLIQCNVEEMP